MLIRITRLVIFILCLLPGQALIAQRVNIAVDPIEHFDPYFEELAGKIEDFVTRQLTQHDGLRVVERTDFSGITDEQERQKNEGFIDGEVVEQGKLVGARLVIRFQYDDDASSMRIQVVDISNGEVLCTDGFSTELRPDGKLPKAVWDGISDNLQGCFKDYTAPAAAPLQIVELLQPLAGMPRLLVYAEDTRKIKLGAEFSIFTITKKLVAGKKVDYPKVLGTLVVEEIENKNFLNGKIVEGSDEIQLQLKEESEIYAKPVK